MKQLLFSTISLVLLGFFANGAPKKDIVDTAIGAGNFNTLVAAIKSAGLVATLKGEGPYTVFAPTDEAFAKLSKDTIDSLLKPENKKMLTEILTYHVISGKVKAKKAAKLDSAETVNGSEVTINPTDESLLINNSLVIKADIKASNGIIHVIDSVLIPASKSTAGKTNHIIMHAIHKGVPMFNSGHHSQTAFIYMDAGNQILDQCPSSTCPASMSTIKTAMQKASSTGCPTSQAWIMRNAFDEVLAAAN